MKKVLMVISIIICLMVTLLATIITDPSSGTTYVGYSMRFRLDCQNFSMPIGTGVTVHRCLMLRMISRGDNIPIEIPEVTRSICIGPTPHIQTTAMA